MAELYSQYASGTQFTAGAIVGSALGTSGINPMIDRLNSISNANGLVIGSVVSGTSLVVVGSKVRAPKTSYYSINPTQWAQFDNYWSMSYGSLVQINTSPRSLNCGINLPHDAVVTSIIVNGSPNTNTWRLYQVDKSSATSYIMASANINSADSTIGSATIDNQNFTYALNAFSFTSGEIIYGGVITYTTDYD